MTTVKDPGKRLIPDRKDLLERNFSLDLVAARPMPDAVLMCPPEYFDVVDIKNVFMKDGLSKVDRDLAARQWQNLKEALENNGVPVKTLPAAAGLEDMVFAANQALVGISQEGEPYTVPGIMRHTSRQNEVPHYLDWFRSKGYRVMNLPDDATSDSKDKIYFEGHGDAIWHPEKMLLWGGYGHRTTYSAYNHLIDIIEVPILLLELTDSTFYHLDTAFCPLDHQTVLYYPGAFSKDGIELIETVFESTIAVSREDAFNFACNAIVSGNNVFLERGSVATCEALLDYGFNIVEVETSEFRKSGGSVFCMTLDIYKDQSSPGTK